MKAYCSADRECLREASWRSKRNEPICLHHLKAGIPLAPVPVTVTQLRNVKADVPAHRQPYRRTK